MSRWCPSCRTKFPGDPPPYSVVHVNTDPPTHLDPVTRVPTGWALADRLARETHGVVPTDAGWDVYRPSETAVRDPDALLDEWLAWWHDTDAAPAKMPGALHMRTAIYLQARGRTVFAPLGPEP